MEESKPKSYYEILEVATDASPEEIRKGYQLAKNAYSQDNIAVYPLMSKSECDRMLELIEEAYSIISDPKKRQQYNEARGISNDLPASTSTPKPVQEQASSSQENMVKIVAKKRFALEFDVDPELEKKIEQAELFDGAFLKEIREYKNVDLVRMADLTKVSKTYLRYIEEETTENLPALVYVRGFVYQYAKCLRLNPDLVAKSYLDNLKAKIAPKE